MKETQEDMGTIRAQERANQHPINADLTVSTSPRGDEWWLDVAHTRAIARRTAALVGDRAEGGSN